MPTPPALEGQKPLKIPIPTPLALRFLGELLRGDLNAAPQKGARCLRNELTTLDPETGEPR